MGECYEKHVFFALASTKKIIAMKLNIKTFQSEIIFTWQNKEFI